MIIIDSLQWPHDWLQSTYKKIRVRRHLSRNNTERPVVGTMPV